MDFSAQLDLLKAAKGDPAKLALATVDLLLGARPAEEREKVREALEAAAVPHWFDEKILAALLNIADADAVARMVRLRELNVVEPFPARGPGAMNVHEAVRAALRARLAANDPERLRALSTCARAHFAADTSAAAVIEALYHRYTSEPEMAADECVTLFGEWDQAGRYASLLALRTVLEELLDARQWALPSGLVRGAALYCLTRIRYRYRRVDDRPEVTKQLAHDALVEYQKSEVIWRIVQARDLHGDVLRREGHLDQAMNEYRAVIDSANIGTSRPGEESGHRYARYVSAAYAKISHILWQIGKTAEANEASRKSREIRNRFAAAPPDNELERDQLQASGNNLAGDMLRKEGNFAGALTAFRAGLAIRERLASVDPENAHWQYEVAVSHYRIGNVLLDQGDLRAAIQAFRAGMVVFKSLASEYPANAAWQKDFADACARIAKLLLRLPDGNRSEVRRLIVQGQRIIEALARPRPLTDKEQKVRDELKRLAAEVGAGLENR